MNTPVLIAGVLTVLAALAHTIVGAREFRWIRGVDNSHRAREVRLQVLCGWHMVSVDLSLAGAVLVLIGATEIIPHESFVLWAFCAWFGLWGLSWLLTVAISGRSTQHALWKVPQWLYVFLISGLCFLGAN